MRQWPLALCSLLSLAPPAKGSIAPTIEVDLSTKGTSESFQKSERRGLIPTVSAYPGTVETFDSVTVSGPGGIGKPLVAAQHLIRPERANSTTGERASPSIPQASSPRPPLSQDSLSHRKSFEEPKPEIPAPLPLRFAESTDEVSPLLAQAPPSRLPPSPEILPRPDPFEEPEPVLPAPLPPPEQLLQPPTEPMPEPDLPSGLPGTADTIVVERFDVIGSTVFSPEQLAEATAPYTNQPITFAEILEARTAVTNLYLDSGYITSGAIFPPQRLEEGVAIIQIIEGSVEAIEINGTQRLNPAYVSSRLGLAVAPPLNRNQLLESLQLLQLNPLIERISADLQAGTTPGTNRLVVEVTEADSFWLTAALDNNSAPSVGSVQRQIGLTEANLLGLGDALTLQYTNTDGSNELDASYTLPLSPRNATLSLSASLSGSRVITPEFEILQISSNYSQFALSFQQPLVQTPTQDLALGVALSYSTSQTRLGFDNIGPFPLSPGADSQGRTTVTSLSFFQTWTERSTEQVLSARSQFNLGLGLLGATVNEVGPDSQFFSWQGQAQWVRLLAPDTLLLLRGSTQIASDVLLSQEQFGLGGQLTVRGYRQDVLLTDSGLQGTAEVRLPVLRVPEVAGLLQVTPFLDAGYGWNVRGLNPNPNALIGLGIGLLWQQPNVFARVDWGIPLTTIPGDKSTLQENGVYFTFSYSFF